MPDFDVPTSLGAAVGPGAERILAVPRTIFSLSGGRESPV